MSSLERWLTALIVIGGSLVYLSLYLQSVRVFVVGEGVCLLAAPVNLWLEREQIRKWWNSRGKCPECGYDLGRVKGDCPGCGHKRILL
jgi:DNA-directed RNA polymerase subunit RPC12/RpoP